MAEVFEYPNNIDNFKSVYGDFWRLARVPQRVIKGFKFKQTGGEFFEEGIRVAEEWGLTLRGALSTSNMETPVASEIKKTQFRPHVTEHRAAVSMDAHKAGFNTQQAFKASVGVVHEAQRDIVVRATEWNLLCGGIPVGVIAAGGIAAGATAAQKIVTMTEASFSGMWAKSKGMRIDLFDSTSISLSTSAVKRNTLGTMQVVSVNVKTREVTIDAANSADWTTAVAGDAFWLRGSYATGTGLVEARGLVGITANQTQPLFAIDPTVYGDWRGLVDNTGGALNMRRIIDMVADIATNSPEETTWMVRMSPRQWNVINAELTAQRRFDQSYRRLASSNFEEIEFFSPNGTIKLSPHPYMPNGYCHVSDDSTCERMGPSDFDVTWPSGAGLPEGRIYLLNPNRNVLEFRVYSWQGMYNRSPDRSGLFTGLTL